MDNNSLGRESANILLLKEKSTLQRAPLIDERKNRLYKIIFIFRIIITEIKTQLKEQSVVKKIITLLPENIDPVALKNKPVRANENNRKVISEPTIDAFSVKFHAIIEGEAEISWPDLYLRDENDYYSGNYNNFTVNIFKRLPFKLKYNLANFHDNGQQIAGRSH